MFKVQDNEIYIYDDIGPQWLGMIDSGSVIDALEQIGSDQEVVVRINSPGGDVVEGLAIFNALKRHTGTVVTYCDGLAASCGSYIFAAGEQRFIAENGVLMIHDPWGMSVGNAEEHRKTADVYDKFASSMAKDYATSANITPEVARDIMKQEVWYTADEAIDAGFATSIMGTVVEEPITVAQGRFNNTPKAVAAKSVETGSRTQYSVSRLRLRNKKVV